jgi:tetratricopeptide (TPR) repeat protein
VKQEAMGSIGRAESLKEEGLRLYRQGDYEAACSLFMEAESLFAEAGDLRGQGETLNNLGVLYLRAQRCAEAQEAFERAKEKFISAEDKIGLAQTLGNLGELFRRRGQREEAVDSLKEAANLLRELGEREKEAKTLELICRIRLEERRWLEALHFYDLSLAAHPGGLKGTILRPLIKIPLSLLSRGSV